MINIISAIGSLGTFIMAIFYFISITVQLYQMKISFVPALGFDQILLEKNQHEELKLRNMFSNTVDHENYLRLYNLGGGTAQSITIKILLGEGDEVIQTKYINMLPSKESYLLPINKTVLKELDKTIQNNGYESNMKIIIIYQHNLSRKQNEMLLKGRIDSFNSYHKTNIYELQFIQEFRNDKN